MRTGIYRCIISFLFLPLVFLGQIINIESKRFVKDTNGFAGRSDFFFSVNRNQVLLLSVGANIHTQYKYNRHRILNVVDYAFIKAGESPFVNNGYFHLRYNFKIKKGWYYEWFGQAQYNLAIRLDRRMLTGTGIRTHLYQKDRSGIFCGLSYMYEYQQMNFKREEYYFHRGSTYLSCFIRSKWVEFTSTFYYQPVLTNFNIYRLSTDTQIELLPGKKVNFVLSFSGFYDELLPEGIPKLIFVSRNTLRLWLR